MDDIWFVEEKKKNTHTYKKTKQKKNRFCGFLSNNSTLISPYEKGWNLKEGKDIQGIYHLVLTDMATSGLLDLEIIKLSVYEVLIKLMFTWEFPFIDISNVIWTASLTF